MPHAAFQEILTRTWASEINSQKVQGTVLICVGDPVIYALAAEIEEKLESVKVMNTCWSKVCKKTCPACTEINSVDSRNIVLRSKTPQKKEARDGSKNKTVLLINCNCQHKLALKTRWVRQVPVKELRISPDVFPAVVSCGKTKIIRKKGGKIHVHPELHKEIAVINSSFQNPLLLLRVLKYLDMERRLRIGAEKKEQPSTKETENIIAGIRISFLTDIEHGHPFEEDKDDPEII